MTCGCESVAFETNLDESGDVISVRIQNLGEQDMEAGVALDRGQGWVPVPNFHPTFKPGTSNELLLGNFDDDGSSATIFDTRRLNLCGTWQPTGE